MSDGGNDVSHYLERERDTLVQTEPAIFQFLLAGSLDGIWYWDLERPEHEWMSGHFWETFGDAPDDLEQLAAEWQEMSEPDDLEVALANFHTHAANASVPCAQLVRSLHQVGSTVWVRCRGSSTARSPKPIVGLRHPTTVAATFDDVGLSVVSDSCDIEDRTAYETNSGGHRKAGVGNSLTSEGGSLVATSGERATVDERSVPRAEPKP